MKNKLLITLENGDSYTVKAKSAADAHRVEKIKRRKLAGRDDIYSITTLKKEK